MSFQVLHIKYKCHIGDVYLEANEHLIIMVRKLNLYEIDLDDNDAIYYGEKDELDRFMELLNPFEDKILLSYRWTSLKDAETSFGLTDIEFLNKYLVENIYLNDILDKIRLEGMESLTLIEKDILTNYSNNM